MNHGQWTEMVERVVSEIDDRIKHGELPGHILTFDDAAAHSTQPFGCVDQLCNVDRGNVIAGVDEVLRIRAGGVH
jgi:hypothetical protein